MAHASLIHLEQMRVVTVSHLSTAIDVGVDMRGIEGEGYEVRVCAVISLEPCLDLTPDLTVVEEVVGYFVCLCAHTSIYQKTTGFVFSCDFSCASAR